MPASGQAGSQTAPTSSIAPAADGLETAFQPFSQAFTVLELLTPTRRANLLRS
jgi:hypothetical protein